MRDQCDLRHIQSPGQARFAVRLSVKDGLITRYHVYEDSLAVAQAFAQDDTVSR